MANKLKKDSPLLQVVITKGQKSWLVVEATKMGVSVSSIIKMLLSEKMGKKK